MEEILSQLSCFFIRNYILAQKYFIKSLMPMDSLSNFEYKFQFSHKLIENYEN